MYFEVYVVATEFRRKMLATAAPFVWLCTVDPKRIAVSGCERRNRVFYFYDCEIRP
jgi:hypothetical protein